MKKSRSIIGLLLLGMVSLIMNTGCAAKSITPPAGAELNEGILTVTLEENPTTGYLWKQRDAYTPTTTSDKVVGSGGNHSWIFKGAAKGETVLTFKYFRPWEKEDTATETRTYTVKVAEDGKITSVK